MTKFSWKKSLPHFTAIILFLLLPIIYFSPVLENKQLNQHDSMTFSGMSKEIIDYNKKSNDLALWTNSMFGGMPSYLIALPTTTAITSIFTISNLYNWRPINFVFLYLIGFYIALLLFGVVPGWPQQARFHLVLGLIILSLLLPGTPRKPQLLVIWLL